MIRTKVLSVAGLLVFLLFAIPILIVLGLLVAVIVSIVHGLSHVAYN